MTDQEELVVAFNDLDYTKKAFEQAEKHYYDLLYHPKNNKFTDQQLAESTINGMLEDLAGSDCEGSYNCGNPQYIQQFYVNDVLYEGILDVEYNRHDKTYYYVEESTFTVKKLEE